MTKEEADYIDKVMNAWNELDSKAMTELANASNRFEFKVGPWTLKYDEDDWD